MRILIFMFLIFFYLQVLGSAGPNKGFSAAGSKKLNFVDKVDSKDRRLADIKETTFEVERHGGTTSHKSPDTGETTGGGGGGVNNHHQSVRHHSSSPPRLIVRDGVLLIAVAALLLCIYCR